MYGYQYRKPTRFWTNITGFTPKTCNKNCGSFINGKHIGSCGGNHKSTGYNYKNQTLKQKYSIPPRLLRELLSHVQH